MGNVTSPLLPKTQRLLNDLGNRLKLARLRRGLEAKQVAERAGMAPLTLRSIERGSSTVTFGAYVAVMQVLGLAEDLNSLAKDDETGRHLQDAKLTRAKPRKRAASSAESQPALPMTAPVKALLTTPLSAPKPAPKKSASAKKAARPPSKQVSAKEPGRQTAAAKLAAQIFKGGDK